MLHRRVAFGSSLLLAYCRAASVASSSVSVLANGMATDARLMRAAVAVDGAAVVETRPLPILKAGEVLVKVHYSAINRADTLQRKGLYPPPPGETDVLGLELTGEVVDVAHDVPAEVAPAVGARVMALVGGGGNAEYCAVNARHLLAVPSSLDWRAAAAVPEVWLTAFQLLHLVGHLQPADTVLVHAAGSGVGTAAVQLARLAGATVVAVAGDDAKLATVAALGAQHTVNYKTHPEFSGRVKEATGGKGATLILDPVGGSFWRQNAEAAAMDARWVLYGSMGGGSIDGGLFAQVLRKRLQILGTTLRARDTAYKAELVRRFSEAALPGLASGALKPVIDSEFALADIQAAHALMESNTTTGKIVLRVI